MSGSESNIPLPWWEGLGEGEKFVVIYASL